MNCWTARTKEPSSVFAFDEQGSRYRRAKAPSLVESQQIKNSTLGQRLNTLRKQKNLSQSELAALVELHFTNISRYERVPSPTHGGYPSSAR